MLFRGRGGRRPRRRGWWARAWSGVRALEVADLGETPLVAVALEGGGQPQREDLAGQAGGDDAAAHRQHVRVVVLAAEAGRVEVVAERSSHAPHLVGRDLLALARAAEHDAAVGLSPDDRTPDGGADRRVVDRLCGVGAEVDHLVTGPLELGHEVDLKVVPGVVGSDGDLLPVPSLLLGCPTAAPVGHAPPAWPPGDPTTPAA